MPKTSVLVERLNALLTERHALRALLARYRPFFESRNFNAQRSELESEITALVTRTLFLSEAEQRREIPSPQHLAGAITALQSAFVHPLVVTNLASVWDYAYTGFQHTTNAQLRERLVDLVGPLDDTLARMLSA